MNGGHKKRLNSIFSRYYNYYNTILNIDLRVDLLKKTDFTIEKPISSDLKLNIIDFLLEISKDIYNLNNKNDRKIRGQYPTVDKQIIRYIINDSLNNSKKDIRNLRILDPCAGTGNFIIVLLYDQFKLSNSIELMLNILDNYVGIEIDPMLIYFQKIQINLLLKYLSNNTSSYSNINIIQGDTTQKKDINEKLQHFNTKTSDKFDIILGNPPYVALYGRRGIQKNESLREYYIKNYDFIPSSVVNGKLNITMFFIEQAINLCNKSGIISFVIDISFFETAFEFIRKYILESTTILNLVLNINSFENVASGQIILTLKNQPLKTKNSRFLISDFSNGKHRSFSQIEWATTPNLKLLLIDDKDKVLISKIEHKSKQLVDFFSGKSLRTNSMLLTYEDIFVKDFQSDNKITFPYFRGGKSLTKKFDKMSYDKFLHYDMALQDSINTTIKHELEEKGIKNKKRIMLGDIKRHYSPKIYIRQSSKEIVSSVYLEPSTSNNSLYSLCINNGEILTTNKNLTLNSVCSQLNSNITTYYAQKLKIIRSGNGKQPQIKLSDLKKIRLTDDLETNNSLENIYNKIQKNLLDCEKAVDAIDKILAQFYGLSTDELEYIKEEISL